jgi:hypothetical protein
VPEPLETIVAAMLAREYELARHVWENYVNEPDRRPEPWVIAPSFSSDDPTIIEHDRNDGRGAACDLRVYNESGRPMFIRVGYAVRPVRIVTAYFEDDPPPGV